MQNDPDYSRPSGKNTYAHCRPESPKSFLNKSCNSNQNKEPIQVEAAIQRVKSICLTNKERAEYMHEPSLNSIGLLPDGAIRIKKDYGEAAREPMLLHQPQIISRKPPICNRKPQMTRLTAGLRETKSSSLRMIRDPEEVLRLKRKLMTGASKSQIEINTRLTPPATRPVKIQKEISSKSSQHIAVEKYKARSLGSDELIDIEDVPFDTLEEMEKFMPAVDRGYTKDTESLITKGTCKIEEKEKAQRAQRRESTAKYYKEECTSTGEIVNIPVKNLKETLLPVKKEAPILSDDILSETTPDIKVCNANTGAAIQNSTNTCVEDKTEKKKKKKKSRLSFNWLAKTKAEKVAPMPVKDKDARPKQRSKADLERIAAMFCVETPQQAGLRRFLSGHGYVDDDEAFIKPGVWDCDIGVKEESYLWKPAARNNACTDVNTVEKGIKDMNLKNNGQCLENGALTGVHKMQNRLRKISRSAQ